MESVHRALYPKHRSWLNPAEIEISLLTRQCLGRRRIGDRASQREETRAWNRRMNRDRVTIQWSFTRTQARKKFGYKITRSRYWSLHSEECVTSLSLQMCPSNQGSLAISIQVWNSVRPMHLFGRNRDHDYYFRLPSEEARDETSDMIGPRRHGHRMKWTRRLALKATR